MEKLTYLQIPARKHQGSFLCCGGNPYWTKPQMIQDDAGALDRMRDSHKQHKHPTQNEVVTLVEAVPIAEAKR